GKVKHGPGDDWNNHPDDVANLTAHAENKWKLDLTWQVIDVSQASVDDLLQVPVLFISGQEPPDFSDEDVEKLRAYVGRGGFLFAECCCDGKTRGFDQELRELIEKRMFPDSPLVRLGENHPVWRVEEKPPLEYVGSLWGVNVGCRTSVIYSERDLSCRWQHGGLQRLRALRGSPEVQQDVRAGLSVGLNVLGYATNRELKYKFEHFDAPDSREPTDSFPRGRLRMATVMHHGGSDAAPSALPNLQHALARTKRLRMSLKPEQLSLTDDKIFEFPVLMMHGRRSFTFSEKERKRLREYVERGGFLMADSVCGSEEFSRSFRKEMKETFPKRPLTRIAAGDDVFTSKFGGHDLKTVRRREPQAGLPGQPLRATERQVEPLLEGVRLGARYGVMFSPYDVSCALENQATLDCKGYVTEDALRIGVNIVMYSLNQPGP
ncbi:MAG: DUF4159 domain-containing protein, partial [Planctomycetales bacterium]